LVGNGTSLTVRGIAAVTAIANDGGTVQLFLVWGALTVNNTYNMTPSNGSAIDYGGAIRARRSAKLSIADSVLISNVAAGSGGAITVSHDTTTVIAGCAFDSNRAVALPGGCITTAFNSTLLISSSSVSSNTADNAGRAINAAARSTVTFTEAHFLRIQQRSIGMYSVLSTAFCNRCCCLAKVAAITKCLLLYSALIP
jgi:hypothetical protein